MEITLTISMFVIWALAIAVAGVLWLGLFELATFLIARFSPRGVNWYALPAPLFGALILISGPAGWIFFWHHRERVRERRQLAAKLGADVPHRA